MGVASATDIGQLLCFRCTQAITADTVIAFTADDDRPNISSPSSRHGAKRRGGLFCSVLFLAVLDPRVSHTMDVLSPYISVLCHSD